MRKGMLFLSAAITTFILVVLAAVVFQVRAAAARARSLAELAASTPISSPTTLPTDTLVPTDTSTPLPTDTALPSPTTPPYVSPQEAVFIASAALGNTQVYSVDTVTRYGMDVYQVEFSSGQIVFVSPLGHILTITTLQPYVQPATSPAQSTTDQQQPSQTTNNPPASQPSGGDDNSGHDD